ncbi:sdnD [Symbiodinium sp. CCMP2592]|nr:sdnD [Symbiodinium sp. CCMP2592]
MVNSTQLITEEVLGHPLRLALFKRSGPALGRAIDELREDLYNLGSVTQMLQADRAAVAVDIGASVGVVSVLLCKLWEGARVVAVEPAPPNFRYLLWNLKLNGVTDCVWPLNVAVGGQPLATTTILYSPTYPTWAQRCQEEASECASSDGSWRGGFADFQLRSDVETVTLAEVMALFGLTTIDFLKVDCEGCEWDVFAPRIWERVRRRIRHVATELHLWALPDKAAEGLESDVRALGARFQCVSFSCRVLFPEDLGFRG